MKRWEQEGFPNAATAKAYALLNSERRSFRVIGRTMLAKGRIEEKNDRVDAMYDQVNDRIDEIKNRVSNTIDRKVNPKVKTAIIVATVVVIMAGTFYFTKDTSDIPGDYHASPSPSASDTNNNSDNYDDSGIEYDGNTPKR